MNDVYLGLGSNLGNRKQQLDNALYAISQQIGTIKQVSSVYQTRSWGRTDLPDFLNQVVQVSTPLTARLLLETLLHIEQQQGRQRLKKWDSRTIDLDILFYNDSVVKTLELVIPHPELHQRRFVLVPLCEIAPQKTHPSLQRTLTDLLHHCSDNGVVTIHGSSIPSEKG